MERLYCWRCKTEVIMLSEPEWETVHPWLLRGITYIKRHRERTGCELNEVPMRTCYASALDAFERIARHREADPVALWHHRRADHGPACHECSKPLRTPRAKHCAACGADRPAPLE